MIQGHVKDSFVKEDKILSSIFYIDVMVTALWINNLSCSEKAQA